MPKQTPTCRAPGCTSTSALRGLCRKHYQRARADIMNGLAPRYDMLDVGYKRRPARNEGPVLSKDVELAQRLTDYRLRLVAAEGLVQQAITQIEEGALSHGMDTLAQALQFLGNEGINEGQQQ